MKKRALILALAGIMAASLIGCGSLKDDAVVVKAGDEEITAGVANFYARYTQAQYETYFASYLGGDDMWSRNASDGKTYEESIKETLLDDLKNMALHMSCRLMHFCSTYHHRRDSLQSMFRTEPVYILHRNLQQTARHMKNLSRRHFWMI